MAKMKYPFRAMEIGDKISLSFEVKSLAVKARIAVHVFGGSTDRRFRTKIIGNTIEVVRVS